MERVIPARDLANSRAQTPHIVDVLIEERARHLRSNPLAWFLVRQILNPLLRYREALTVADAIADLPGKAVFDLILERLRLRLDIAGLEHLPKSGPCVVVANHPTGIADGLALYQAAKGARDDLCFVANRDALRVSPGLADVVIPVEWVIEKRSLAKTREMWRLVREAFGGGRTVVMFPSGRVAQLRGGRLVDRPWQAATIAFARRNKVPVVPLHLTARNSWIYYAFSAVSPELRDMTLFNELLNKEGKLFRLRFGPVIPYEDLAGEPDTEILRLRKYVEDELPAGKAWTR